MKKNIRKINKRMNKKLKKIFKKARKKILPIITFGSLLIIEFTPYLIRINEMVEVFLHFKDYIALFVSIILSWS